MHLTRRSLKTVQAEAKDPRRKPGSVKPAPAGHGSAPAPHVRLLPGGADDLSKKQLGYRSHQQRLARTKTTTVTFSNGIATKNVSVIESTPKRAAKEARKRARLAKAWKVVAINGRSFTE